MASGDLTLLRRKEVVGILALIGWGYWALPGYLLAGVSHDYVYDYLRALALIAGWALTAAWVAFDASYRQTRFVAWTFLTLATGPLGFLLYYVSRPPTVPVCTQCGRSLANGYQACPTCGYQSFYARTTSTIKEVYSRLADSLARGPVENSRKTAKHMAFAFAASGFLSLFIVAAIPGPVLRQLMILIYGLSVAAYWVLVAWWVYLDATWRRMDAVPWGILTLVTNLIGLATYLVIRYPEPRTCAQCGATIPQNLKRCPYCGAQPEPTCPHCQAAVRPDWIYCPACAAKLPPAQAAVPAQAAPSVPTSLSISGSVTDAATGSPIAGAQVRVDSRTITVSATTDELGRFALRDLAARAYVLVASAEGYVSAVKAHSPSAWGSAQTHFSLVPVGAHVTASPTDGADDAASDAVGDP